MRLCRFYGTISPSIHTALSTKTRENVLVNLSLMQPNAAVAEFVMEPFILVLRFYFMFLLSNRLWKIVCILGL